MTIEKLENIVIELHMIARDLTSSNPRIAQHLRETADRDSE